MILKLLREGLGRLIVLADIATRPKPVQRTPECQKAVDDAVAGLSLYQFFACPFCIKTRRAIHRLNLPIELRNAQQPGEHRTALETSGGKVQVPCLRRDEDGETHWLYESSAIIAYLESRFGEAAEATGNCR